MCIERKGAGGRRASSPSRNAPARLHPSLLHYAVSSCPPHPPHTHLPCRRSGDSDTVHLQLSLSLSPSVCVCARVRSGLLEISAVERGVISLYGVRSELFVAMNSKGRLYGTVSFPRPPMCGHARAPPSIPPLHGRMPHIDRGLTLVREVFRCEVFRCGEDAERLLDKILYCMICLSLVFLVSKKKSANWAYLSAPPGTIYSFPPLHSQYSKTQLCQFGRVHRPNACSLKYCPVMLLKIQEGLNRMWVGGVQYFSSS